MILTTEYSLGYMAAGNVGILALACAGYMAGGRANKWIRRFGASFLLSLAVNVTALLLGAWSLWLLLIYPLLVGQYSLGYSDNAGWGWIKRLMITALSVASGAFLCWVFGGGWSLLIIHALMGAGTVVFSRVNVLPASVEETLVCLLNSGIILFYPFVTVLK